jgi:hypothetical protein
LPQFDSGRGDGCSAVMRPFPFETP